MDIRLGCPQHAGSAGRRAAKACQFRAPYPPRGSLICRAPHEQVRPSSGASVSQAQAREQLKERILYEQALVVEACSQL